MSDMDRLDALEHMSEMQRAAWLQQAAVAAGWHDPEAAGLVIDKNAIATEGDAQRAVDSFTAANPYYRKAEDTQEDVERRWGEELLRGLEQGGRHN